MTAPGWDSRDGEEPLALLEAYQIMAGRTMKQPTAEHLRALLQAHNADLARIAKEIAELRERIGS
jgi:hypothetical protein